MLYLVDGYNVLHTLGLLKKGSASDAAERARRALLQRIVSALGPDADQVIVFFDAAHAPADLPREEQFGLVRVRYSPRHQDADSLILELLPQYVPSRLVVVSADHQLRQAARRRKCHSWTPEQFLAWLEKCRRQRLAPQAPSTESKEELARHDQAIWLREFAHLNEDPTLGTSPPFGQLREEDMLDEDGSKRQG